MLTTHKARGIWQRRAVYVAISEYAHQLQPQDDTDCVDDGIHSADLVEMDVVDRHAMHTRLRLSKLHERGERLSLHLPGQRRGIEQCLDLRVAAHRAVAVRVAVAVAVRVAVPVLLLRLSAVAVRVAVTVLLLRLSAVAVRVAVSVLLLRLSAVAVRVAVTVLLLRLSAVAVRVTVALIVGSTLGLCSGTLAILVVAVAVTVTVTLAVTVAVTVALAFGVAVAVAMAVGFVRPRSFRMREWIAVVNAFGSIGGRRCDSARVRDSWFQPKLLRVVVDAPDIDLGR